ncbi:MAG: hypothetical protein GF365_00820 [Candidatus Buchananbacteria bacterium]|nr:hypothetical protein [Candidatus Buchananbacteria bacterium]
MQQNTQTLESANQAVQTQTINYCLYARKSTESEERQALSIDSQIKEMLRVADKEKLNVVNIKRESHSAKKSGERPVFREILKDVNAGKYNGILTWAPDRLSRNAGDLGEIVDLMDKKLLVEIKTYSQCFTNSPNEKFLLMILGSQAKLENDNRGINVKRGLRTRVEMGLWPATAPTGYLNEKRIDRKCEVIVDPKRGPIVKQMFEKVATEKWSGRKVYMWLREIDFKTISGKPLALSNVLRILKTPFYTGTFEYPKESGNWYAGKHQPLITQELFDQVQQQLTRDHIKRGALKEFAFTRLMTCGLCGSGISAEEKHKKLSDGTTKKYIYYGCTRAKDINCKCGYINEDSLVSQLLDIIDKISIDKLGITHKYEQEMKRFSNFQQKILGVKLDDKKLKNLNVKNYAKYILTEGTVIEKRELLSCMRSKVALANKLIKLS